MSATEDMTLWESIKYHSFRKAIDVFERLYGSEVLAACIWEEANMGEGFDIRRFYRTFIFKMAWPENREEIKARYYMSLENARVQTAKKFTVRHGSVGGTPNLMVWLG